MTGGRSGRFSGVVIGMGAGGAGLGFRERGQGAGLPGGEEGFELCQERGEEGVEVAAQAQGVDGARKEACPLAGQWGWCREQGLWLCC